MTADVMQAVEQLSALVADVEREDPERAALLVSGFSSACWAWQRDRLPRLTSAARTELLAKMVERTAEVGESDPDDDSRALFDAAQFLLARTRADFERRTGQRIEDVP